jgi:hypothetical protein
MKVLVVKNKQIDPDFEKAILELKKAHARITYISEEEYARLQNIPKETSDEDEAYRRDVRAMRGFIKGIPPFEREEEDRV